VKQRAEAVSAPQKLLHAAQRCAGPNIDAPGRVACVPGLKIPKF